MKLKEYQGKELFKKYNIAVPMGFVVRSLEDVNEIKKSLPEEVVLKSQILTGGRGKSGGIIFSNKENVDEDIKKILNKKIKDFVVKEVLIVREGLPELPNVRGKARNKK
ncbi:ATP-grasp domain-containing protein [Nanoarchaeota archaeon]